MEMDLDADDGYTGDSGGGGSGSSHLPPRYFSPGGAGVSAAEPNVDPPHPGGIASWKRHVNWTRSVNVTTNDGPHSDAELTELLKLLGNMRDGATGVVFSGGLGGHVDADVEEGRPAQQEQEEAEERGEGEGEGLVEVKMEEEEEMPATTTRGAGRRRKAKAWEVGEDGGGDGSEPRGSPEFGEANPTADGRQGGSAAWEAEDEGGDGGHQADEPGRNPTVPDSTTQERLGAGSPPHRSCPSPLWVNDTASQRPPPTPTDQMTVARASMAYKTSLLNEAALSALKTRVATLETQLATAHASVVATRHRVASLEQAAMDRAKWERNREKFEAGATKEMETLRREVERRWGEPDDGEEEETSSEDAVVHYGSRAWPAHLRERLASPGLAPLKPHHMEVVDGLAAAVFRGVYSTRQPRVVVWEGEHRVALPEAFVDLLVRRVKRHPHLPNLPFVEEGGGRRTPGAAGSATPRRERPAMDRTSMAGSARPRSRGRPATDPPLGGRTPGPSPMEDPILVDESSESEPEQRRGRSKTRRPVRGVPVRGPVRRRREEVVEVDSRESSSSDDGRGRRGSSDDVRGRPGRELKRGPGELRRAHAPSRGAGRSNASAGSGHPQKKRRRHEEVELVEITEDDYQPVAKRTRSKSNGREQSAGSERSPARSVTVDTEREDAGGPSRRENREILVTQWDSDGFLQEYPPGYEPGSEQAEPRGRTPQPGSRSTQRRASEWSREQEARARSRSIISRHSGFTDEDRGRRSTRAPSTRPATPAGRAGGLSRASQEADDASLPPLQNRRSTAGRGSVGPTPPRTEASPPPAPAAWMPTFASDNLTATSTDLRPPDKVCAGCRAKSSSRWTMGRDRRQYCINCFKSGKATRRTDVAEGCSNISYPSLSEPRERARSRSRSRSGR
ncbi:hypothetical protein HDU96_011032 [Phlyctochytrium bullatum]|nr:hypothetical protein HDU96_011032 [Phlyctochytrium bullatum]